MDAHIDGRRGTLRALTSRSLAAFFSRPIRRSARGGSRGRLTRRGSWTYVDLTGIWRLHQRSFGVWRWWIFDVAQQGSALTGNTLFRKEIWQLTSSIVECGSSHPVTGEIDGTQVRLAFEMDRCGDIERLTGQLRGDALVGDEWYAERVRTLAR